MKNRLLSLSFVLFTVAGVCSVENASAQEKEKDVVMEAEDAFAASEWIIAAKNYKQLVSNNPDNAFYHSNLGYCYLQCGKKDMALTELKKAQSLYASSNSKNKTAAYLNEYYIGTTLRQSDKITEALSVLNAVKPQVSDKELLGKIDNEIKACAFANELKSHPKDIKVLNLGRFVNSAAQEHTSIVSADNSVLFLTSRKKVEGHQTMDDGGYDENVYVCTKNPNTQTWAEPQLVEGINSEYNVAVACMSSDGKELYLYNDDKNGTILVSKKLGNRWGEPTALNAFINTDYRETGVSISKDGNKLYFASNRDAANAQGGLDLYVSDRVNGEWGPAVNLGPTVNTPMDEDGPFMSDDGTLYFSSKGHNGLGGYDIFKSNLTGVKWSTPENLGSPINTSADEIFYFIAKDGKAYFTSDRPNGSGASDLYVSGPSKLMETSQTIYQGAVTHCDKSVLTKSIVRVHDNSTAEETQITPNNYGNFEIKAYKGHNYSVSFELDGEIISGADTLFDVPLNAPALVNYQTVKLDPGVVCPVVDTTPSVVVTDPIAKNVEDVKSGDVVIELKDVKFEFASSEIGVSNTLDELAAYLNSNKKAKVKILGYCDAVGSAAFNKELSLKRATSAKNYLVGKKGVKASQLEVAGMGEENPITLNVLNGEFNENAKQYNRRLEFEVIKQGEHKLIVKPLSVPSNFYNKNYKSSGYKASKRNPETEI